MKNLFLLFTLIFVLSSCEFLPQTTAETTNETTVETVAETVLPALTALPPITYIRQRKMPTELTALTSISPHAPQFALQRKRNKKEALPPFLHFRDTKVQFGYIVLKSKFYVL